MYKILKNCYESSPNDPETVFIKYPGIDRNVRCQVNGFVPSYPQSRAPEMLTRTRQLHALAQNPVMHAIERYDHSCNRRRTVSADNLMIFHLPHAWGISLPCLSPPTAAATGKRLPRSPCNVGTACSIGAAVSRKAHQHKFRSTKSPATTPLPNFKPATPSLTSLKPFTRSVKFSMSSPSSSSSSS